MSHVRGNTNSDSYSETCGERGLLAGGQSLAGLAAPNLVFDVGLVSRVAYGLRATPRPVRRLERI